MHFKCLEEVQRKRLGLIDTVIVILAGISSMSILYSLTNVGMKDLR